MQKQRLSFCAVSFMSSFQSGFNLRNHFDSKSCAYVAQTHGLSQFSSEL